MLILIWLFLIGRRDILINQSNVLIHALALNPKLHGAYYNRSIVYSRLGEYEQSNTDLEQLANSSDPEAELFFIELTFFLENGFERNSTKPFGIVEKIS